VVQVVVSREPEWDDQQRANMLALSDYEADLCECGFPSAVADEDPDLQIRYRECPVCSGLARAVRIQDDADKRLVSQVYGQKGPQPADELPSDGRRMVGLEAKANDN
jgi:hypothetical protein